MYKSQIKSPEKLGLCLFCHTKILSYCKSEFLHNVRWASRLLRLKSFLRSFIPDSLAASLALSFGRILGWIITAVTTVASHGGGEPPKKWSNLVPTGGSKYQYWKQQEMSTSKRCCTGVVIRCKCFLVSWTLIHPCLRRLLTRLWLSARLCRTRQVKSVFSRLSLSSPSAELTLTFSTAANKSSKTCQDRALAKTSLHSRLRFSCYWSWLWVSAWERFTRLHPTSQAWHGTTHSIN